MRIPIRPRLIAIYAASLVAALMGVTVCADDTPGGFISHGTMHYYVRDNQGNVRQVTDGDGVVEHDNHNHFYLRFLRFLKY